MIGNVAEAVENLLYQHETLSSNPSPAKKKVMFLPCFHHLAIYSSFFP
jgi:hypothetical protein